MMIQDPYKGQSHRANMAIQPLKAGSSISPHTTQSLSKSKIPSEAKWLEGWYCWLSLAEKTALWAFWISEKPSNQILMKHPETVQSKRRGRCDHHESLGSGQRNAKDTASANAIIAQTSFAVMMFRRIFISNLFCSYVFTVSSQH